jgi:Fic family protein
LPIRLFTRRTYTAEDIWRVVYFRHGSVDDFSKKILSFADVSKLTGIPQETVRRQLDQFEKDGFTVFIRRHYNGNLGSDPKIFLKMEERLKSV